MNAENIIDLASRKHLRDLQHKEQLAMHEFARWAGPIIEELAERPLPQLKILQIDIDRAYAARLAWDDATDEAEKARWNARQEDE